MPPVAKVSINGSRNSGDVGSGTDRLDDIYNELRNLNRTIGKESKLGQSGLLGGRLGNLLKGIGGTGLGIAAGIGAATTIPGSESSGVTYNKALIDGEQSVVGVNRKTGEIVEILTEREAIEKNIMNANGQIMSSYNFQNDIFDKITSTLPKYRDSVILSAETVESITSKTDEENFLRGEINKLLAAQIRQLERQTRMSAEGYEKKALSMGLGPVSHEAYKEAVAQEFRKQDELKVLLAGGMPFLPGMESILSRNR